MITESFDDKTRPLIGLSDLYGEKGDIADTCIITFSSYIQSVVCFAYKCKKVTEMRSANGNIPVYCFEHNGRKIIFYLSPIGSACAATAVIDVHWLTGATKFIMFGSSGSLDHEKTQNKFVIPTEAYRDEGMSYHYAPPADYIKVKNSGVVKSIFEEIGVPYVEGRVWTTDAIYRETVGQAAKRREDGCIAVDMELAGVQAVCNYHGLELYDFLVTGDVLMENSYSVGTLADANHNIDKFRLALEIIEKI